MLHLHQLERLQPAGTHILPYETGLTSIRAAADRADAATLDTATPSTSQRVPAAAESREPLDR